MKDAVMARASAAPSFEIFNTKSAAGVDCTRLLGAVSLGLKHLKKPAAWRALKQTSKRLL